MVWSAIVLNVSNSLTINNIYIYMSTTHKHQGSQLLHCQFSALKKILAKTNHRPMPSRNSAVSLHISRLQCAALLCLGCPPVLILWLKLSYPFVLEPKPNCWVWGLNQLATTGNKRLWHFNTCVIIYNNNRSSVHTIHRCRMISINLHIIFIDLYYLYIYMISIYLYIR